MSTAFEIPSCPECYLVVSNMKKHRAVEHGVIEPEPEPESETGEEPVIIDS